MIAFESIGKKESMGHKKPIHRNVSRLGGGDVGELQEIIRNFAWNCIGTGI